MQRREETARFQAKADDGSTHTVVERTMINTYQPISGAAQHVKGTRDYVTARGEPLNQIDDDTYQFVMTDLIIRRV